VFRVSQRANLGRYRNLAARYRELAERAGNAAIWDARLRTAEELEKEAGRVGRRREPRSSASREEET
jgi:hypothetical protein